MRPVASLSIMAGCGCSARATRVCLAPYLNGIRGRAFQEYGTLPPFLLIADDVAGGFFALDGGGLGAGQGEVFYFAPDTLAWENMDFGYTEFLQWCFAGETEKFYQDYRWDGWEQEVNALDGDKGFSIYPFPSSDGGPISQRHRGIVPIAELYELYVGGLV